MRLPLRIALAVVFSALTARLALGQRLGCEFVHRQQDFRFDMPCDWYGQEDRRSVLMFAPRRYSEVLRVDINEHLSPSELEDHRRAEKSRIQNRLRQALETKVELRDTSFALDGVRLEGWAFDFEWEAQAMEGLFVMAYRRGRLYSLDWVAPALWHTTRERLFASFRWLGRP